MKQFMDQLDIFNISFDKGIRTFYGRINRRYITKLKNALSKYAELNVEEIQDNIEYKELNEILTLSKEYDQEYKIRSLDCLGRSLLIIQLRLIDKKLITAKAENRYAVEKLNDFYINAGYPPVRSVL